MSANGKLLSSELKNVQPSSKMPGYTLQLPTKAANSYLAFEVFAKARGRDPFITDPGGAYRPDWMQADMLARPTWYGAKLGKVASVGTSVHGQLPGCVDISNWASFGTDSLGKYSPTLDAWFGAFGWRRTISGEPWHYQYNGVSYGGGEASGVIDEGEAPMLFIRKGADTAPTWGWYVPGVGWRATTDRAVAVAVKKANGGDDSVLLTDAEWTVVMAAIPNPTGGTVEPAQILAALKPDLDEIDAAIAAISVGSGPTAGEIAQAVRDEIIAPDA